VKKLFFLFITLSMFSQILAQSSSVNTQTISDILTREEPSLQEVAQVINLELQHCGLGAYFLLNWPGIALCGYTPLTIGEIQDKTANFMTTQKTGLQMVQGFGFQMVILVKLVTLKFLEGHTRFCILRPLIY
jgi:hypothetical protein